MNLSNAESALALYSTNSRNLLDLRASGLDFEVTVFMPLVSFPRDLGLITHFVILS